ncbi:MAG: hypothetical protein J3Q66DRAFT_406720 [Benniella sp.]|nr:MAG: hypothetical protein J3Q66DRAFT_406720 [Benniella sp.]
MDTLSPLTVHTSQMLTTIGPHLRCRFRPKVIKLTKDLALQIPLWTPAHTTSFDPTHTAHATSSDLIDISDAASADETARSGFKDRSRQTFKNKWIKKDDERLVREAASTVDPNTVGCPSMSVAPELTSTHAGLAQRVKGARLPFAYREASDRLGSGHARYGPWKTPTLEKYSFAWDLPESGHHHRLMKIREASRKVFFELG